MAEDDDASVFPATNKESSVKHTFLASAAALVLGGVMAAGTAQAQTRDQIRIVGSSTVFPFTQAAAEEYAQKSGKRAPVVESTGTGGGMKIFCGGIGPAHADITGASRAMTESEYKDCVKNGVTDITEVQIGFDGIAFAASKSGSDVALTTKHLFQALASEVEVDGKIVANPYKTWNQVDKALPNTPITVFGPPPTSGTRDAWVELVMHKGCNEFPAIKALRNSDRKRWDVVCSRMRQDGPFIEAGENDNLIVQRLGADRNAHGIFGFSFLYENLDRLKGVKINNIEPKIETIADGSYPVSRPIFFYVKNAHRKVIPGLQEFVAEYVSVQAMGKGGYLTERGLIPLSDQKGAEVRKSATGGAKMTRYSM
jgi:phosphate transport system substrate-binding protein